MIEAGPLAIVVAAVVLGAWLFVRVRDRGAGAERRRSKRRHRAARNREPPVDVGDERVAGIEDFSAHHSGERRAVCRVEGFVVFVEDVPDGLAVGDTIRFRILSYNRGHTSANAVYLGRG